jgi:hypothetical protein
MGVADIVTSVKDAVVPANRDQTLRNAFGYQALGFGAMMIAAPHWYMGQFGVTAMSGAATMMSRGLGLGCLMMSGQLTGGTDSEAAATGFLWFALWHRHLKANAALFGGYIGALITWDLAMAVIAARRQGGLWKTITSLDVDGLNAVLPTSYDLKLRNFVGMQMAAWGVMCAFFQPFLFGKYVLSMASTPLTSVLATGISFQNFLVGGKIMAGSDEAAAPKGVLFFGGWAVLAAMAKSAGVLTGQYTNVLIAWNALSALYCAKTML